MQPMPPVDPARPGWAGAAVPPYGPPPQPGLVPLPPRFVRRFRTGLPTIAITLIIGTALLYGLVWLVGLVAYLPVLPRVLTALPPLCVLGTVVVLLAARRCLRGPYLVVANARVHRNLIVGFLLANALTSVVALIGGFAAGSGGFALFAVLPVLFVGAIGSAAGHLFVRPSVQTLHRFADRPVW